ncbi:hypothetical protein Tco_1242924 [Tanacetum coccineum]
MEEPNLRGLDTCGLPCPIVMRTVSNTVDTGRTIVCSIHQPSIKIFEAFDVLFLMKRGGQELYGGPVGRHSCDLIKYFKDIDRERVAGMYSALPYALAQVLVEIPYILA